MGDGDDERRQGPERAPKLSKHVLLIERGTTQRPGHALFDTEPRNGPQFIIPLAQPGFVM